MTDVFFVDINGLTLDELEEIAIRHAMKKLRGKRADVSKALNIAPRTLYAKLKTYALRGRPVAIE